jgi:type II secretory pathway predicted ATPase ExeA
MYCDFYQMRERPFNVTADPKFLYLNARYREALASLHYGITQRKGFITLIGEAGTGKTTLLKKLLDDLDQSTRTVFVFNTNVTFDEILEYIFGEFDLPVHNGKRLYMLQRLNTFLLDELGKGRNVALLIDEAQDLDYSVLEDLRLLSNLETAKEKILQIVLSGQPELGQKLGNPGLRQLRQRIAVSCRLLPLTREELTEYIQARLTAAAAADPKLFTRDAEERIFEISTGIPRLVNIVCDNSLVIGYALGKKRIGADVVNEAAADLLTSRELGSEPVLGTDLVETHPPIAVSSPPRFRRRSQIGVIAVVVVALVIGLLEVGRSLLLRDPGPTEHAAATHPLREVIQPGLVDDPEPRAPRQAGVDASGGTALAAAPRDTGPDGAAPALAAAPPPAAPPVAGDPPAAAGPAPNGNEVAAAAPAGHAWIAAAEQPGAAAPAPAAPVAEQAQREPRAPAAGGGAAAGGMVTAAAPPAVAGLAAPAPPAVAPAPPAVAPAPPAIAPASSSSAPAAPAVAPVVGSAPGFPGPSAAVAKVPEAAPDTVDDLRLVLPEYRRIMVKPGDSISQIATNTYGQASATMLDLMKMANPSIRDIDIISVGQELRLPQLDQGLAVLQEPDGQYALLVLSTPAEQRAREIGRALRKHGFEARVGRADFGGGRAVWRVVIGDLADRAAAQTVGKQLQRVVREDTRIAAMADRLESNER